jgi:sulfatase modifying factor 1
MRFETSRQNTMPQTTTSRWSQNSCRTTTATALILCLCITGPAQALIHIETVTVGDPGNAGEWAGVSYGGDGDDRVCGAVDYIYEIGQYEITTTQYAAFLNAAAATDTYGLWNPSMAETPEDPTDACGITRSGVDGSYSYAVVPGSENRPVNFVSFWSACRFVNWLENGQPVGTQDASTTEDGSYTLNGYTGMDGGWIVRNPGARYVIPSEDEWYKAAYFKVGTNGEYWDYPTQSDSILTLEDPPGGPNSANLYDDGYATTCGCMTDVGAYDLAIGPYGTFDQAGNVGEYTDSIIGVFGGYTARGWEGGAFEGGGLGETISMLSKAAANSRNHYPPHAYWVDHTGFRIVKLPDCNENGIPDSCDLSCGESGGFCDVPGCGTGTDCNSNGVPDECDLITPWVPIYSTDFSTDPEWITNNAGNYLWQDVDGDYFINQFNIGYGGEYSYHETGYRGGSFRMEWDILMERNDYASAVNVGIYDADLDSHTTGSYVHVWFARIDQGHIIHLGAADANDVTYYDTDYSVQYAFDTWYRVILTYDAVNATVTAEVREKSTGTLLATLSFNNVGPFGTDMTRIGSSNVRANATFQVPGADSAGRLDNMILYVPSPDCNANNLPDECEIDGNDCNANSIPDDCEPDFDADGLIDDCDPDIDEDGVPNEDDACNYSPLGAPIITDPTSCLLGTLRGDYDTDCDVDLRDFALFELEMTGPR